jgi:hypothetical protein
MKKTDAKNRRKRNPRVFVPFLPAWVYLIDDTSRLGAVRAWPWLHHDASNLESSKISSPHKDRTV